MKMRFGRAGWCVHYEAISDTDTCAAGVNYVERFGPELGIMRRMPCFLNRETNKPSSAEALGCDKFRAPTPEEIEADRLYMQKRAEKLAVVMVAVAPWREQHKGQNFAETIECPACKGRLHLSITRSNGHVWGRCTTPDCVSWIE